MALLLPPLGSLHRIFWNNGSQIARKWSYQAWHISVFCPKCELFTNGVHLQLRVTSIIYIALIIIGSALANHSKRDFSCFELVLVKIIISPNCLTFFKLCVCKYMCVCMYYIYYFLSHFILFISCYSYSIPQHMILLYFLVCYMLKMYIWGFSTRNYR